jgi:AcrR family transcriptional regulator
MSSLRERKKLRTRAAIHDAAMRLFAERGFEATTVADIAEAAEVSRATFFSYFAGKDDVVFGDAPLAIEALAAALDETPSGHGTLVAVREWLRTLAGWLDDDRLPLQLQLAAEVSSVAARRLQNYGRLEDIVAAAVARGLDADDRELTARMVAAAMVGALGTAEKTAAERTRATGKALSDEEVDRLLDKTMAFVEGGLRQLGVDLE